MDDAAKVKFEGADNSPPLDPLRRVFLPREFANGELRTRDGERYVRDGRGTIKRFTVKINGKVARKLRAKSRKTWPSSS